MDSIELDGHALVLSMKEEFAFRNRHVAALVTPQMSEGIKRGIAAMRDLASLMEKGRA